MSEHDPEYYDVVRASVETYLKRPLTDDEFKDMRHKIATIERGKNLLQDANYVIGDALFRQCGEFIQRLRIITDAVDRRTTITLWVASIAGILLVAGVGYIEWLRRPEANVRPAEEIKRAFTDAGVAVSVRDDGLMLAVEFDENSLGEFQTPSVSQDKTGNITVEYRRTMMPKKQ